MSSYQHQYSMGEFYKEVPDFLTCGFCSKEFLLDNISLFIAHKSGCVDKSQPSSFIEDTSAPLTCSMCSRVFMTARGLLQHIQRDHQMKICLQKGPLLLPDPPVRPPPAHSSVNGIEYTTTDNQKSGQAAREGHAPPSDPSDEPTDLSMTCSNSMGKATVLCSEEECKIIIEPNVNAKRGGCCTALPKKRKFIFAKCDDSDDHNTGSPRGPKLASADIGDELRPSSRNDGQKSSDHTDPGQASICVTAEYQQQSLTSFCLSTGRKECGRNAKLKQLLENNRAEGSHPAEQQDEAKTKYVYNFPFQGPYKQEPDSEDTQTRSPEDDDQRFKLDSLDDSDGGVSGSSILRFIPGTTLEQNIDQLIRASISSDSFPEELDIFSLAENTPKNMADTVSGARYSPSTQAPQPDEKYKRSSQQTISDIDVSLENSDKTIASQALTAKQVDSPGGCLKREPSFSLPIPVPCPVKSRISGNGRKHGVYNRKSLSLDVLSSPSPELKFDPQGEPFQNLHGLGGEKPDQTGRRRYDAVLLRSVDECHGNGFHGQPRVTLSRSDNLCPPHASLMPEPRRRESVKWLSLQAEECGHTNLAADSFGQIGVAKKPSLTRSNSIDDVINSSFDQLTPDSDDVQILDGKMMKKRRYPTSRPFKCSHCDQAFNQRIHLKKHMSKHTGVKPFKCQQCDYSTVERSHLKVHYRIHTGEKPYRCQFCDYATAQNSTLKIHLKRHHDGTPTSDGNRSRDGYHQPVPRGGEEEDSLLSDTFFVGVSAAESPPLDGSSLMRTPMVYGPDGLLGDQGRPSLSDHARGTSSLVAMESTRRGVLHGKRDNSPNPYSYALKGNDVPSHFMSSAKTEALPHKLTSLLPNLRHSRFETAPRKTTLFVPEMHIADPEMAKLKPKEPTSGLEDRTKQKLPAELTASDDRHHVSSRGASENLREADGCLRRDTDGRETYSDMFQARPIKKEVKVDEVYGADPAAGNYVRRSPDEMRQSDPNLAGCKAALDQSHRQEHHPLAAINLTHQAKPASGSPGDVRCSESRPPGNSSSSSLSSRAPSSKSDSRLTAGWESEDDDDSDLEFSVCPPSVNIPNKAFVRG